MYVRHTKKQHEPPLYLECAVHELLPPYPNLGRLHCDAMSDRVRLLLPVEMNDLWSLLCSSSVFDIGHWLGICRSTVSSHFSIFIPAPVSLFLYRCLFPYLVLLLPAHSCRVRSDSRRTSNSAVHVALPQSSSQ